MFRPYGLHGGEDGQSGRNTWIKRPRAADGDLPLDVNAEEAESRRVYLGGKLNLSLLSPSEKGEQLLILFDANS